MIDIIVTSSVAHISPCRISFHASNIWGEHVLS